MASNQHIAVVGAGLAGLSCATALQAAGHRVTVLEKSRGVAGRMSTRRGEGWQCDHGAQYFTARSDAFAAELARWQQAGVAALWSPRLAVFGGAAPHQPAKPDRQGAALQRFVGRPQMTAPAQWLAASLKEPVRVGKQVEALLPSGSGWRLQADGAGVAELFDAVVLALPAPQAQVLLRGLPPGLATNLAQRAAAVKMRACWALMLNYAAPLALGFDAAFVNQGPLRWVARNSSKPARPGGSAEAVGDGLGEPESWLLHARAEWSEARLQMPAGQVAVELQEAFAALGGPTTEQWSAHRWLYADVAPAIAAGPAEAELPGVDFAWDPGLRLGLCGDWLGAGKVEGAWLSGQNLAQRVLAGS
jgi:predicted NAD/FAD-dependent oxidoreductase